MGYKSRSNYSTGLKKCLPSCQAICCRQSEITAQTYFTIKEAAAYIRVHPKTIGRMIKKKILKFTIVGERKRIPVSSLIPFA